MTTMNEEEVEQIPINNPPGKFHFYALDESKPAVVKIGDKEIEVNLRSKNDNG